MLPNQLSKNLDLEQAIGQFLLTAETGTPPHGWALHESGTWRLYTCSLPVVPVYNEAKCWLGWCIGHLILDGRLHPDEVVLRTPGTDFNMDAIDDFYQRSAGKWALLLVTPSYDRIFLDPYGSLATVYSTIERTVASTPTLIGSDDDWDGELIAAVGLPEQGNWLPSGLTTKKNVRRLLPNHSLHLTDWTISRHWPTAETVLAIDSDTKTAVENIVSNMQKTIKAVAADYPLCFSVTAGRDSRMVLACARNYLNTSAFFTFQSDKPSFDTEISALMAAKLGLNHSFFVREKATPEELNRWLALTGLSVAGNIWKGHKTLEKLDSTRVLMPGTAGEVGRAYYWWSSDKQDKKLTAADLLTRCKLPHHPALLKATEAWMAELPFVNTFTLLDLFYLEQRLGCWAAPQHYGNTTSAFEFIPFNSRPVFHVMMRLPYDYRRKQQLAIAICEYAWPELLQFPFNEFTGIRGFFSTKKKQAKTLIKKMIGR